MDINLEDNDIRSDQVMRQMTNAFLANPYLNRVQLSHNIFSDRCLGYIAEFLVQRPVIKSLALIDCQIDDKGAEALTPAIASSIRILLLRSNRIKDQGAKAIAGAIERNADFQKLELQANYLGDAGGKALATAFAKMENFVSLNVIME